MDNPIHAPELDEQSLINLGNRTIPQSRGSNGQSQLALLVGGPITRHRTRDSQPCTQKTKCPIQGEHNHLTRMRRRISKRGSGRRAARTETRGGADGGPGPLPEGLGDGGHGARRAGGERLHGLARVAARDAAGAGFRSGARGGFKSQDEGMGTRWIRGGAGEPHVVAARLWIRRLWLRPTVSLAQRPRRRATDVPGPPPGRLSVWRLGGWSLCELTWMGTAGLDGPEP
jgi:hypothetical protein